MLSTPELSLKCMEMSQDHIVLTCELNISTFIVSGAKAPLGLCRFTSCGSSSTQSSKTPETGHRFDSLRQINRKHWGLRSMYGVWREWQKKVRHEEREMEQVWNRVWASGSTLLLSDTVSPHLQLTFPAARFFHNLSHSQELLPTAKNLLPNLIMTLQTLVTIALWEHIHTYSLQWLWPQVKLSI